MGRQHPAHHRRRPWCEDSAMTMRCFAAMLLIGVNIRAAIAQKPGEAAPPEIATVTIARAEQFLRDVARLSPMPPGTDPDRAQAWPRRDYREFRAPGATTTEVFERAQTKTVDAHPYTEDPRMGPGWTVHLYGNEMEITIDPATGAVKNFLDGILITALGLDPAPDSAQCISAETALARGVQYLQLTGLNLNELVLHSVRFVDMAQPATASTRVWGIFWLRTWQGVTFRDQEVSVTLDAGRGRLLTHGARIAAKPPTEARLGISVDRAVEIAREFVVAQGGAAVGEPRAELQIVLPTDTWTAPHHMPTRHDPNSRLAWIVQFSGTLDDTTTERLLEVWVDAINGAVLGGDIYTRMGKKPQPFVGGAVGGLLRSAQRLEVLEVVPDKRKKPAKTAAKPRALDAKSEPLKFYGVLSGIRSLPSGKKQLPFNVTHHLAVFMPKTRRVTWDYDAKQGLIRDGKTQIVQAGATLRAWVSPMKPAAVPANR